MILEEFESPIGTILLVTRGELVCALDFGDCRDRMHTLLRRHYGDEAARAGKAVSDARLRLSDYFRGDLKAVDPLRVDAVGTAFQRAVWAALRTIPPGRVKSYGELAAQIGRPAASRAVGAANSQNPVAIVQPCHRVIGANAKLVGYAGGLHRKEWLLAHERARAIAA